MVEALVKDEVIRAGDQAGRLDVYTAAGELILLPHESLLRTSSGWDMTVISPWRRFLPKVIFLGFNKRASSRLYITTQRIVFLREIDPWRETTPEMTPLGMPNAVARGAELRKLRASGAWQFCEVSTNRLRVVRVQRSRAGVTWIGLRLIGDNGRQYRVSFWKTDGEDVDTLSLIETRFRR